MRSILLLAVLSAAAASLPCDAQAQINRCTSNDGTPVFTDQDCHLLGTAYRMPAAYDARPAVRRPGTSSVRGAGMPRFGIGCAARTPEALRSAVRAALDSGDPNQLAGLYDWNGASRAHAMDVLRRMQRLTSRPAISVELGAEYYEYGSLTPMSQPLGDEVAHPLSGGRLPSIHVLRAHGEPGPAEPVRFEIVRDSGCLWLSF